MLFVKHKGICSKPESWMGRSSFAESSVGVVMWCHVAASRPWCPREECGGHHGSVGSVKSAATPCCKSGFNRRIHEDAACRVAADAYTYARMLHAAAAQPGAASPWAEGWAMHALAGVDCCLVRLDA